MSKKHPQATTAFTLMEILIALTIMTIIATMVLPKLTGSLPASEATVARAQALKLDGALKSWLLSAGSISAARTTFNPSASADTPSDLSGFLGNLLLELDSNSQPVYYVSSSDATHLVTKVMENNSWYMRIIWPGANYRNAEPRIEFVGP